LIDKAVLVVLFDEERHRIRRKREGLRLFMLVEEIPQGLVFPGASEDLDELLELDERWACSWSGSKAQLKKR
jgi:hypothetical protein